MTEVIFVTCPLCCMSRPLVKKGSKAIEQHKLDPATPEQERKGRVRFDAFDLENSYLIQYREGGGSYPISEGEATARLVARQRGDKKSKVGRGKSPGKGFPVVGGLTLSQVRAMPEYQDLIIQIRDFCQKIVPDLT